MAGALSWAGRGAAALCAVALGWASVGSALDRAAAEVPALAASVPQPFRANAERIATVDAIQRQDFAAAARHAAAYVSAEPMDASSSALLGAALQGVEKFQEADTAFRTSGALGWRDPVTQTYWLQVAIGAGEDRIAAERLDALLRANPSNEITTRAVALLESRPSGRTALAGRLATNPAWTADYVRNAGALRGEALTQRVGTLQQAVAAGMKIDCEWIAPSVNSLFQGGLLSEAAALWFSSCVPERERGALIQDAGFDRGAKVSVGTPFEWMLGAEGGLEVERGPAPAGMRGQALTVRSSNPVTQTIASQVLLLKPGRYRIAARAAREDGAASAALALRIACAKGAAIEIARDGRFAVPGGCPAQILALTVPPGAGTLILDGLDLKAE